MTVKEIIKKYLKDNNYDGLYSPGECACKIDDLVSCGSDSSNCEAGISVDCKKCAKEGKDEKGECFTGHDFCIGPKLEGTNAPEK